MPTINILVLENDSSFGSSLKINLNKWGAVSIVVFKNVTEGLKYMDSHTVDLIIAKPTLKEKGDGIKFGQTIASRFIPMIYIAEADDNSSYEQVRKLNLLSFLVKPFDFKTLYATLNLYFDNKENFLIINKGKNRIRVKYNTINWIKSSGNYCIIRTDTLEYSMKISLTRLRESFLDNSFIQIHRAFIIRIDKIDNINVKTNEVNIKQVKLPIGRKYRKDFFDRIEVI